MGKKEIFYKDISECTDPLTHVSGGPIDPALKETDELFGAADVLSIKNSERHRRILLALSAAGTLLTLSFLLYDEVELYSLILACGAMILCLALIMRIAGRLDCHRKHIEYRVLAESLRLQFFLSKAGCSKRVSDIMPWTVKKGIPWIEEIMASLSAEAPGEKQPVIDCWIRDQKAYHERALVKAEQKNQRDNRISRIILFITVIAYCAALIFELIIVKRLTIGAGTDIIRTVLKVLLGTMSAVTLFTGSYYGKMSLPNEIDDHTRMIALYESAEQSILESGETDELLLSLARDYLNENSTWYAYQSKNTPDIVL